MFVEGYGILSFAKSMGKNIGKTISKNLSGKYSSGMLAICKKLLDYAEKSATYALKTFSKRVIQKRAEATGDLIGSKIDKIITKVSEKSKQNNWETVANDNDNEIPKEKYIPPEEKHKITDNLRSIIIV